MKINLHCHSQYSDGIEALAVMTLKHKEQNFEAMVITDHLYPSHYGDRSLTLNKFEQQRREIRSLSEYLEYPIIQGIELAVGWEEVLVFGSQVIWEILKFLDSNRELSYEEKIDKIWVLLYKYKKSSAYIMCHPQLDLGSEDNPTNYDKLFGLIDGFERYNTGVDMFSLRDIPPQLITKSQWNNSDAHFLHQVELGNNPSCRIEIGKNMESKFVKWVKGKKV